MEKTNTSVADVLTEKSLDRLNVIGLGYNAKEIADLLGMSVPIANGIFTRFEDALGFKSCRSLRIFAFYRLVASIQDAGRYDELVGLFINASKRGFNGSEMSLAEAIDMKGVRSRGHFNDEHLKAMDAMECGDSMKDVAGCAKVSESVFINCCKHIKQALSMDTEKLFYFALLRLCIMKIENGEDIMSRFTDVQRSVPLMPADVIPALKYCKCLQL